MFYTKHQYPAEQWLININLPCPKATGAWHPLLGKVLPHIQGIRLNNRRTHRAVALATFPTEHPAAPLHHPLDLHQATLPGGEKRPERQAALLQDFCDRNSPASYQLVQQSRVRGKHSSRLDYRWRARRKPINRNRVNKPRTNPRLIAGFTTGSR